MTLSLQNPAIGKVTAMQQELCRLLEKQKQHLQSFKGAGVLADKGTLTHTSADAHIHVLENEIPKVEKLELLVAVVGAMKAGKSTTINAIVGSEVLPNRSGAMTSLPTVIRHNPECSEPRLHFKKCAPFNQLITTLRQVIKDADPSTLDKISANADLEKLVKEIKEKPQFKFAQDYAGTEAIYQFLFYLNDIVRLGAELSSPAPLDEYTQMADFPCIEVEFSTLKDVQNSEGTFSLLDTPGPNEASAGGTLRKVVQEQLKKASAVLAVLDYTQRSNDADSEIHDFLKSVEKERLFVALNKVDQKGHKETIQDVNAIREGIAKTMGDISVGRVLGISSQRAMFANRALHALKTKGELPPLTEDWVRSFAEFAFGEYDEEDLEDSKQVSKRANKVLEKSQFPALIANVVAACYQNAPAMVFHSALDKLKTIHAGQHGVADFLQVRNEAAKKEDSELRQAIAQMDENLKKLRAAQAQLGDTLRAGKKKGNMQTAAAQEEIRKEIDAALEVFFTKGELANYKELDRLRKEAEAHKKATSGWNTDVFKIFKAEAKKVPDFDPSKIEIVFDTAEQAGAYSMSIIEKVNPIFQDADKKIMAIVDADLKKLAGEMQKGVKAIITPLADKIQKDMKDMGFSMQFGLSQEDTQKIVSPQLDDSSLGLGKKYVEESYRAEKSGFWSWFKRQLNNDWGYETRYKTVIKPMVNLNTMRAQINSKFDTYFIKVNKTLENITTKSIEQGIRTIEQSLNQRLENWQEDFEAERHNKQAEIEKQEFTRKFFAKATEDHALLQKEIQFTRSEVDGLKASPM